jgi:uncharacterized small protein (DUF1192 family)
MPTKENAMEDNLGLRGWYNGQRVPNPEAFGFKWRPMQKLLKDHQRIWQESRDNSRRYRELQEEIERLKRQETEDLATSIRAGHEEPDGSALREAQEALAKCEKREVAIERALEKVNAEILEVTRQHAAQWGQEVQERVNVQAARVESIAAELAAAQTALSATSALHGWLSKPERGLAFSPGPSSLETFAATPPRVSSQSPAA